MNSYPTFPQRPFALPNNAANVMAMSGDAMPGDAMDYGIVGEQSLDEMVTQNDRASRRKSMPPVYGGVPMQMASPDPRRMSMLDFNDASGNLNEFQFNYQTAADTDGMMRPAPSYPSNPSNIPTDRGPGPGPGPGPDPDLSINTQFPAQSSTFANMQAPGGSAYASPMHPNLSMDMDMDMNSPFTTAMPMPLDMSDPALAIMGTNMNMFSNTQFAPQMMDSPINQEFVGPISAPPLETNAATNNMRPVDQFGSRSISTTSEATPAIHSRAGSQDLTASRSISRTQSDNKPTPPSNQGHMSPPVSTNQKTLSMTVGQDVAVDAFAQMKFPWTVPAGGFPSTMNSNPHMNTQFKNAYSSTGFDMLGVLMRVATRQNPQIDIGSVDLSCAFVVCDAQLDDNPIVYCSENFERLTGYSKHMILGRNCRFLQSPDGKVEPGVKRKYVDDDSVLYLKNMISTQAEAQISLINYRRGGQPFMNLLTMIPVPWEPGGAVKFFVGFQVDLVEQPGSMTNKNPDGSYRVNYQRDGSIPNYIFNPDTHRPHSEVGQTISKDEVSNVLATYGSAPDSEFTKRIWDKVLLENTDDVIYVLSLKGLFLYLSPSSNRVLEYEPGELVGTALSSVCHPSDIVPVTRELKETTNGTSVNVVFRIRRKQNGYMWFEGHGSLHTEQGKGRKCIILVGRERPVYTLSKTILRSSGGIGDNELWSKLSTSGMFLFVSGNVRQLLDRQPEELVGSSIQALMRQESKQNFGRILEIARTGRKAEIKHEMINRRGQVLQAFTTIYPGDAVEGQKPTFIVAQTRLLKYSRNSAAQRPSMYTSKERTSGESAASHHSGAHSNVSPAHAGTVSGHGGSSTPHTNISDSRFQSTEQSATTLAGQHGLPIGHQDQSLASDDNVFDELKTTRSTSWQYELRQMEKRNRYLAEEVQSLLAAKKKRKRRKGAGQMQKDCANCHTRTTPEWRRGPSGNRDLCNSCGLRWAKQNGRVSPRSNHSHSDKSKKSLSPRHNQVILPNVMQETNNQSSIPSTLAQGENHNGDTSPRQASAVSHNAKVARMEAAASQGYGGGIPQRIEEGNEME